MNRRIASYGMTAVLAAALWIVPSVGTRGQGTLGDRFVHPDSTVLAGAAEPDARTRAALARADALVASVVAGL